jgi:hypothetical protein
MRGTDTVSEASAAPRRANHAPETGQSFRLFDQGAPEVIQVLVDYRK